MYEKATAEVVPLSFSLSLYLVFSLSLAFRVRLWRAPARSQLTRSLSTTDRMWLGARSVPSMQQSLKRAEPDNSTGAATSPL